MTDAPGSSLYLGQVVHARVRPRRHRLVYRVASLLLDVDAIDALAGRLRLFSRNRPNVVAFYDRDHGDGSGAPVAGQARRAFRSAGLAAACDRVLLLAYPRMLGTLFNPISVYYGLDAAGRLRGLIYEVNNTVGERTSYVIAAGDPVAGIHAHACGKAMYVSPFTPGDAHYGFRVTRPGRELLLAVQVSDREGGVLRTHFRGAAAPLSDRSLARVALAYPLLGLKVGGAILLEAARLYAKGVPVVRRHRSPRYSIVHVEATRPGPGS